MCPSYIEVLNKLKELKKATSTQIAKEFYNDGERWETIRSSVLSHLKRAERFRSDVSGYFGVGKARSGKNRAMVIFNIEKN